MFDPWKMQLFKINCLNKKWTFINSFISYYFFKKSFPNLLFRECFFNVNTMHFYLQWLLFSKVNRHGEYSREWHVLPKVIFFSHIDSECLYPKLKLWVGRKRRKKNKPLSFKTIKRLVTYMTPRNTAREWVNLTPVYHIAVYLVCIYLAIPM